MTFHDAEQAKRYQVVRDLQGQYMEGYGHGALTALVVTGVTTSIFPRWDQMTQAQWLVSLAITVLSLATAATIAFAWRYHRLRNPTT